jgi:hypothetical protein
MKLNYTPRTPQAIPDEPKNVSWPFLNKYYSDIQEDLKNMAAPGTSELALSALPDDGDSVSWTHTLTGIEPKYRSGFNRCG